VYAGGRGLRRVDGSDWDLELEYMRACDNGYGDEVEVEVEAGLQMLLGMKMWKIRRLRVCRS